MIDVAQRGFTQHSEQAQVQDRPAWRPAPYALLRFAGKPYEELDRLRFGKTIAIFEQIIEIRQTLDTRKGALCDALFIEVGRQPPEARPLLVALKRNIYNDRTTPMADLRALRQLLSVDLRRQVLVCLRMQRRLARLMRLARQLFERELVEKRRLFQHSCQDTDFQKALQIASPALFAGLRDYLRASPAGLRARERKVEAGAFRYFARMTAKTSPFSRFGPVALAQVDLQASQALTLRHPSMRMRSQTSFNLSVVSYLTSSLSHAPEIRPQLRLHVNDSYYVENDEIIFVRPKLVDDLPVYASMNALRRGKYLSAMRQVVELLERHREGLTLRQSVELLSNGARPDSLTYQNTEAFVLKLISSGLIVCELKLPSNTLERLSILQQQLSALGGSTPAQAARVLQTLRQLAPQLALASVAERQQIFAQVHTSAEELMRWWQPPSRAKAERSDLLIEDALVDQLAVTLGPGFFEPFLQDVGQFLECLYARDRGGLSSAMLHDIFIACYGPAGRCDNLHKFAAQYMRMISETDLTDVQLYRRGAQVNSQTARYMRALEQESLTDEDQHQRWITHETLEQLAAEYGAPLRGPLSMALNLQIAAEDAAALERGDFLVALNYTLPGFGHFFTRYCYLFDQTSQTRPLSALLQHTVDQLERDLPGGHELVELLSILDHNAQVHPCFTHRQIVPPGETSSLAAEQQISVRQLALEHDAESDQLKLLVGDGDQRREIIPLYMGFFHMMALPALHRLLVTLSPTGYHMEQLKPSDQREGLLLFTPDAPEQQQVRHYPRLRLGRFVLQRELWAFPPQHFPPQKTQDSFELFWSVYSWARQHQLPREVFVRIKRDRRTATIDFHTDHKPMLVDFENYFTVEMFRDLLMAEHVQALHVEEMLPNPRQLFFKLDDQRYAVEFQLEFSRGVAGHD